MTWKRDRTHCLAALVEHAGQGGTVRVGFEEHIVTVAAHRISTVTWWVHPGWWKLCVRSKIRAVGIAAAGLRGGRRGTGRDHRTGIARTRQDRTRGSSARMEMFERGADAVSFETIVATGANSAIPHHRPTPAVLATGTS